MFRAIAFLFVVLILAGAGDAQAGTQHADFTVAVTVAPRLEVQTSSLDGQGVRLNVSTEAPDTAVVRLRVDGGAYAVCSANVCRNERSPEAALVTPSGEAALVAYVKPPARAAGEDVVVTLAE
jgi:hypothetical protein